MSLRLIFLYVAVCVALFAGRGAASHRCHNVTGTCLAHGFVCVTGQVVAHAKRCDGVEDCSDGTDEFLCHDRDPRPLHERSAKERRAAAQGQYSCARCTCVATSLTITSGNPWFTFAVNSYLDPAGLLTGGADPYAGQPCSIKFTTGLTVRVFRKDRFCRGPLCCMRQLACTACTAPYNFLFRCIA